ncbi:Serine/threonine-protein phosphatase [Aphelenchoides besseyi]|nr:Serine/threonine-protein phosphatase [Aphelenchoides besseyi]
MPPLDLHTFIGKHLKFRQTVEYTGDDLIQLLEMAKPYFCHDRDQQALIDVQIPVRIVGDIHGQFFDLQRIFMSMGLPGSQRFLFLGDYVDRGPNSVECIALLLALKLAAPQRIFLLRGNHESEYVNRTYGFWDELARRFKIGIAMKLYKDFNNIFTHLPLAALVRGRILCMHGGLSPRLHSLNDIRNIRLPIVEPIPGTLAQDLLWSDPALNVQGFEHNRLREVSVVFGEDVVVKACKKMSLDFIVRAHQVMPNGYGFFANRRLNNRGAVMVIDRSMCVSYAILNPVETQTAGADNFRRTFNESMTASNYSNVQ